MLCKLYLLYLSFSSCALLLGQAVEQNPLQAILDKTEKSVSMTVNGSPFHAEMSITGAKKESPYDGSILVDWSSPTRYRVEVRSAKFHDVKIVDGDQVEEEKEGDFYPGWLHSFAVGLLKPMFVKSLLLDSKASVGMSKSSNGAVTKLCVDRNDRPGGIRDEMTWSGMCITSEGLLVHCHNFMSWMDYSDYQVFAGKQIARSYATFAGSDEEINGRLTTLRALGAAEISAIQVKKVTSGDERIDLALISTKDEEARLDSAHAFEWPLVREGKTEGYMIVKALTDVTGQVRETSKYNSDNPGLEEAGREAAMGYKFKPMLVDGVAVEMEMPLVLHFKTSIGDPLPTLRGAELLKQITGCDVKLISNPPVRSDVKPTHISVNEDGKLTGEGFGPQVNAGDPAVIVSLSSEISPGGSQGLFNCKFAPLLRNGIVTYYHGDLLVIHAK